MDTVLVNQHSRERTDICLGDEADKIRAVWPVLKERLDCGMQARKDRSVKINAALLYDGDGVWLACTAFYGWTLATVGPAVLNLQGACNTTNAYTVLLWALDQGETIEQLQPTFLDIILLVHANARHQGTLGVVQRECERTMADELNRFLPAPDTLAPLRLSLLMVREFHGWTGDAWRDVFPNEQMYQEVAPFLVAMSICEADGIAWRTADHTDRQFCLETLEDAARAPDLIHAQDEVWLMNRYSTHVMCADVETLERIRGTLKGKRLTVCYDVHMIDTMHQDDALGELMRNYPPGMLTQGKVCTWLVPERPLGISMRHYICHETESEEDK